MEFSFEMQHTKESLTALAHMQYDLFCTVNLVVKTVLSLVCLIYGTTHLEQWWGVLLAVYGAFLLNTKYVSANRTANKLAAQLEAANLPFPASRFCFYKNRMDIIPLPEGSGETTAMPYEEFFRMGEDTDYIYIFRNEFGGYMIPKSAIGADEAVFRRFLREKTGKKIVLKKAPPLARFLNNIRQRSSRSSEPPHL